MQKVLSITVKNSNQHGIDTREFEFKELNQLLSEGWVIINSEFINSVTSGHFTAVYHLSN